MKKFITFVRHGSLPAEVANTMVGHCDVPLSETGREEALAVGRYLKNRSFDAAYSGNLARVVETRELVYSIAENLPPNIITDPRLNEMDFGDWSLRPVTEAPPDTWEVGNPDYRFPGGECMGDFMARTRGALAAICASPAEKVVIFSHGGVIMGLLADMIGLPRNNQFHLWVERGSVAEVVVCDDGRNRLNRIFRPLDFF